MNEYIKEVLHYEKKTPTRTISARISVKDIEAVNKQCKKHGINQSSFIRIAITNELEKWISGSNIDGE